MRIARMRTDRGIVHVREGVHGPVAIEDPYAAFAAGRTPRDIEGAVDGDLLPPSPHVVVGIAQNGPGHPAPVQAWLKNPRTVVGSGTPVVLRRDAGATVAEGEIAVVLGRDIAGLTAETAHEYVLGVTAVNDLSSPDRGDVDPRNFEGKSGVGYTPLADWIETDADLDAVTLTLAVDGATVAATSAAELPVSIRQCLAYVAHWAPLGPGDVIMTGAPFSQAVVVPGQTVEVAVAGVTLRTPLH